MDILRVTMLGELSLEWDGNRISAGDNRSKKTWLLLAYLISRRDRPVPQNEIISLLWGSESGSGNPENVLKVTMHRVRSLLNQLRPDAGHKLILRQEEGYLWNRKIPMELDVERFERLCRGTREEQLTALKLYRGEFLGKLAAETWMVSLATHYHNLYIRTLLEVLDRLAAEGAYDRIVELCTAAVPLEPYHEQLHRHLMRALIALEDKKAAAGVYERLRERLAHDFGITPEEKTRAIWQEATDTSADRTMPIETVLEHLLEQEPAVGAMRCDFDSFKVICRAEARAMIRSGHTTHVALLAVTGAGSKTLTQRSLEKAMENLGEQIQMNLRRGDVFTRCSASQYVIMLPQANFENSCVVCRRLINAYNRRYPHTTVRVHYLVRPLVPSLPEKEQ